jgi:hypothetical protein
MIDFAGATAAHCSAWTKWTTNRRQAHLVSLSFEIMDT